MKIPKKIQIGGREIIVETVDDIAKFTDDDDQWCIGLASFNNSKIYLQKVGGKHKIDHNLQEEVFCHELVHWWFDRLGVEQEERVVQGLGQYLHEFLSNRERSVTRAKRGEAK